MLVTAAVVLLIGWFLGVLGMYDLGVIVHVLLLAGLLLLLVGVLKARDAATLHGQRPDSAAKAHSHGSE